VAAAVGLLWLAAGLRGDELTLFSGRELEAAAGGASAAATFDLVAPDAEAPRDAGGRPAVRRCVLFQCEPLPIEPATRLFPKGAALWTAAGVFSGFLDGFQNPLRYGFQPFHFTDEGFFASWTYAGGADKASHAIVSENVAGLLYDAYVLNGLASEQAFALALATTVVAGALVEIGDALTPYGFSAQDLTADTVGALAGSLIRHGGLEDTIGFQIGKIPTTLPPAVTAGHFEGLGFDYSNEMYTTSLKLDGLFRRLDALPGPARYLLVSFAFLTKGFGYAPPIPSRYQEVGFEVGLNFPAILRGVGVDDSTWWGDLLLRTFDFLRIPYTQVGTYYNLKNHRWYGPGAPYHYY
jgi:hypothetical protein